MQGLVLVQIMFEKYTTNLYFENGKADIKTAVANLRPMTIILVPEYLLGVKVGQKTPNQFLNLITKLKKNVKLKMKTVYNLI